MLPKDFSFISDYYNWERYFSQYPANEVFCLILKQDDWLLGFTTHQYIIGHIAPKQIKHYMLTENNKWRKLHKEKNQDE